MEKYELEEIQLNFSAEGVKRCRIEVIDKYIKSGQASWKKVVSALREMGEHTLANRLEGKYIKPRESKLIRLFLTRTHTWCQDENITST